MKIQLPKNVEYILKALMQHGHQAYIVGGCVRDSVLGKTPQDWDITTSAKPEETKAIFRRTVDTGIEHGTVTVLVDQIGYEVTTYRVDGAYKDHRRPEAVTFTASLEEDLRRRDFTINAMAYNQEEGLIDCFHGVEDLKHGIIRCVGVPQERFDEDALRILRGVRFAAQLGFQIEEKTRQAIREKAGFLKDISAERIQVELTKLITSPHPECMIDAYELGITAVVLPEFDQMMHTPQHTRHHCHDVGRHTIEVMKHIEPQPVLRWAALLHDVGKPKCRTTDEEGRDHFYGHPAEGKEIAGQVLRRLKMDNETVFRVKRLVEWHDFGIDGKVSERGLRKALNRMGPDLFEDYSKLRKADMMGQSDYKWEQKEEAYHRLLQSYQRILERGDCLSVKDLAIDGKRLIALGIPPGPDMGWLLHELLMQVLEQPERNTEQQLEEMAVRLYQAKKTE